MVSPSEHTHRVRSRKKVKAGKKRKRALRAKGTTPAFPIHKDTAEKPSSGQPSK
jgi:hypothetical protein